MKRSKVTLRETVMLIILAVLVFGLLYNSLFYAPLKEELASISSQSVVMDEQIAAAMTKVNKKKDMEKELEEILSGPKEEITEFAPYDNKEVVLNMLYGILGRTVDYSLSFTDPDVQEDGTVRRNITMKFTCSSYEDAKQVIRDLTRSQWRCLVTNCSIAANGSYLEALAREEAKGNKKNGKNQEEKAEVFMDYNDMMTQYVDVSLTVTFFESTLLS